MLNTEAQFVEQHDYYPFGMEFAGRQGGDIKYRYNGKELQDMKIGGRGLDWYDYGARFYDPALGRWNVQDPLAEYHFNQSPYNYVENNPLLYIDPFGLNKEDRQERRRQRRAKRRNQKVPEDLRYDLPGVDCVGSAPSTPKPIDPKNLANKGGTVPGGIFLWSIFGEGSAGIGTTNKDVESLNLDWLLILLIAQHGSIPTERIEAINEAIAKAKNAIEEATVTSDEEIYEKNTGNSKAASPQKKTIVKTYSEKSNKEVVSKRGFYNRFNKDTTKLYEVRPKSGDTIWVWPTNPDGTVKNPPEPYK